MTEQRISDETPRETPFAELPHHSAIVQAVAHVMTPGTTPEQAAWAIGCALDEVLVGPRAALAEAQWEPLRQRAADALADEVAVLIKNRVIDSRSPAADALLDYRDPPRTERSDALAEAQRENERLKAAVLAGRDWMRHFEWCDFSRHAGYEYGDDTEALERDHPCDCGAAAAFDLIDATLGGNVFDQQRTYEILAWRERQKGFQALEQHVAALRDALRVEIDEAQTWTKEDGERSAAILANTAAGSAAWLAAHDAQLRAEWEAKR